MAEDEEPEIGQDSKAASEVGPSLDGREEERRLLAQVEGGRGSDATEAMRRLVLSVLRQARSATGEGGRDPDPSK
jgi:hypothetical protein